MVQSVDWLARGGTYIVLGSVWVCSAGFFYYFGTRHGTRIGSPTDGCLYGLCNIVLAFLGGGVGFLLLLHHYPYFIISSCLGALLAPGVGSLYFIAKTKSSRR